MPSRGTACLMKDLTDETLLTGVSQGLFFLAVESNLSVPDIWPPGNERDLSFYDYFREMSPIF